MPAAALGAAVAARPEYMERPRVANGIHDAMQGCFLGSCLTDESVERFLREQSISGIFWNDCDLFSEVATHLWRQAK
jgi:predicted NodU family carbamoyl transferase